MSNGSRLILYERPHAPISIRAAFFAGSRFDPEGKEGVAHFLEHMLLAGSARFPTKDKLAVHIEQYGGGFQAFTGADTLGIEVSVGDPADLIYACEILHEILLEPLFDERTMETERGSILRERANKRSNPSSMLWELWRKTFFQGTPVGRSTLGSEETINAISKDDLVGFRAAHLVSGQACFIASGGIKMEELREDFEKALIVPRSEPFSFEEDLPIYRERPVLIEPYTKTDQVHLMYGFRAPRALHADGPALEVIAKMLGGGRASILQRMLRYEKGLVYDSSAFSTTMGDCGSWMAMTSTSRDKVKEVLRTISGEVRRVMNDGLTEEELAFVKNKIMRSSLMKMQTSASWVDLHADLEPFNRNGIWTLADQLEAIGAVTPAMTRDVARRYFGPDKWFLAACGDIQEDELDIPW